MTRKARITQKHAKKIQKTQAGVFVGRLVLEFFCADVFEGCCFALLGLLWSDVFLCWWFCLLEFSVLVFLLAAVFVGSCFCLMVFLSAGVLVGWCFRGPVCLIAGVSVCCFCGPVFLSVGIFLLVCRWDVVFLFVGVFLSDVCVCFYQK